MGVNLGDIIPKEKKDITDFSRKVIAIDAPNAIYQFLSSIRQPDGTPLMDSTGRVTSHLVGLFTRTANLIGTGTKIVYVFDGKPHQLKYETINERREIKKKAETEWQIALEAGDLEKAKSKAQQTSRLTSDMINESKTLLEYLGVPYVVAPSEGEAQASYMARKGDVWAAASQDFDALLFGSLILVRNLTITGRRKLPGKQVYVDVTPEIINLDSALRSLEITREQLVDLGILVGTDFNDGIKGVGAKTALKLIKEHKTIEKVLEFKNTSIKNYETIKDIFLKPDVTDDYKIDSGKIDIVCVKKFLCEERGFSENRVDAALKKFEAFKETVAQKSLEDWF
ncbi:MAG: flap endonuclease-1 [Thermoplasmata archaeon]